MLEVQAENMSRIAKEKEELTKDKASLVVQLTAAERENRSQSEVCIIKSIVTNQNRSLLLF